MVLTTPVVTGHTGIEQNTIKQTRKSNDNKSKSQSKKGKKNRKICNICVAA